MATLNVTITEELTLNGVDRGSKNNLSVGSVTQVLSRMVDLPANGGSGTTDTTVANFRTLVTTADSALKDDDVKYVRMTNLDSSNDITLSLQLAANGGADASTTASVLLPAGQTFILGKAVGIAAVDDDAAGKVTSLVDLESIIAVNGNNAIVSLEIFIAS
tara:strand:+ start:255 stop:737 length:483 start_codon:yes stop_codon:yes gene_type:complete